MRESNDPVLWSIGMLRRDLQRACFRLRRTCRLGRDPVDASAGRASERTTGFTKHLRPELLRQR